MKRRAFFAFPNHEQLRETIERGITRASHVARTLDIKPWPQVNVAGHFISTDISAEILESAFIFGDITFPNFNVFYELGFAYGSGKHVIATASLAYDDPSRLVQKLGLFDTIGQLRYQNSDELAEEIAKLGEPKPIRFPVKDLNSARPVFFVEPRVKSDAVLSVKRRLALAKIQFRSFDPLEEPRLALTFAHGSVQQSVAVITVLLGDGEADSTENNLRAAFVAGLCHGMGRRVLILQRGAGPVPIDFRDFVNQFTTEEQFNQIFNDLAPLVLESLQVGPRLAEQKQRSLVERLEIGAASAENEAEALKTYYVEMDQARQVLAGAVRLVVGRKGTGKSALFFHAIHSLGNDQRKLVLALKPDGPQIKRFKEMILATLDEPAKEHVATAFWEYLLLLECVRMVLASDKQTHVHNHRINAKYRGLGDTYESHGGSTAVDFTDLLAGQIERLQQKLVGLADRPVLTAAQITSAMYASDIVKLRQDVRTYLKARGVEAWVFIDNLDKGWPTRGVTSDDVIILRGVIDATRKLEQFMSRDDVRLHAVTFIRNDVYEHLVDETPDRGKEARVSLDWSDPAQLKELIRKRLLYSGQFDPGEMFDQVWRQVSTSHVSGVDSFDYLVDRSMMRPRNLISILAYARSNSVNLQHGRITADDFEKALATYSADATREIGLEIRDIFPEAEDILYAFIGKPKRLTVIAVATTLRIELGESLDVIGTIELLLWFGFLGVVLRTPLAGDKNIFIQDANYDLKKLLKLSEGLDNPDTLLCINPAFWPFLDVTD